MKVCIVCKESFDEPHEYKTCDACRKHIREKRYRLQEAKRKANPNMQICSCCSTPFESDKYKLCDICRNRSVEWNSINHERVLKNGKEYRQVNRERLNEQGRDYRKVNPEKRRETCRNYRLANIDKVHEYGRIYRRATRDKRKLYEKEYRAANRIKELTRQKKWRLDNLEKVRERDRNYARKVYPKNREKILKINRKWRRDHPWVKRANEHNRKARINGNGGVLPHNAEPILFKEQNGLCYLCGELLYGRFNDPPTIEHKIPVSRGGTNYISNIGLAHASCNSKKHTMTYEEYLMRRDAR